MSGAFVPINQERVVHTVRDPGSSSALEEVLPSVEVEKLYATPPLSLSNLALDIEAQMDTNATHAEDTASSEATSSYDGGSDRASSRALSHAESAARKSPRTPLKRKRGRWNKRQARALRARMAHGPYYEKLKEGLHLFPENFKLAINKNSTTITPCRI